MAQRLRRRPHELLRQTVAHEALGTSVAAFSVWVEDPSTLLVENLERASGLPGEGSARWDEGSASLARRPRG
jgi:hypothetical protein